MRCKQCGEDFPNLNALTKHKEKCSGILNDSVKKPKAKKQAETQPIIPISLCPEELKYLAPGVTVGVKVEGKYTPDGILIQEVTLIR